MKSEKLKDLEKEALFLEQYHDFRNYVGYDYCANLNCFGIPCHLCPVIKALSTQLKNFHKYDSENKKSRF